MSCHVSKKFLFVSSHISCYKNDQMSTVMFLIIIIISISSSQYHPSTLSANFVYFLPLIQKSKLDHDASEVLVSKHDDKTLFQGDICGPIAATMNEAMFLLVISKWRDAFEGLKETNDYKSLSTAGSLMKNMVKDSAVL